MGRFLSFMLLALVMAGLTGCSRPTRVDTTRYSKPEHTYSRILVVGLSNDLTRRYRFETTMTAALRRTGNEAWASSAILDSGVDLTPETVRAAAQQVDADALLITRLVNQRVKTTEIEGRTRVKTRRKNETPLDFFRYDYNEYDEPGYVLLSSDVELRTDFYATSDGRLIETIDTLTYEKETEFEVLNEATSAIVRQLRRDRLVR